MDLHVNISIGSWIADVSSIIVDSPFVSFQSIGPTSVRAIRQVCYSNGIQSYYATGIPSEFNHIQYIKEHPPRLTRNIPRGNATRNWHVF